jgi:hypothetical protein
MNNSPMSLAQALALAAAALICLSVRAQDAPVDRQER